MGPFPLVGLTLTWFIWDINLALHITLYSVNSVLISSLLFQRLRGIVGALKHRMVLAGYMNLRPEKEDSARGLIENLNPSSVVNAENVDLDILPKDLLGTSFILIIY